MFTIKIDDGFCGKEWAGTYTISVLYAPFSLQIFKKVRKQVKKEKIDLTDEETLSNMISWTILKESVKKDGKPLPDKIPHKLYMRLYPEVSRLNDLSLEERQGLFLESTVEKEQK